MDWLQEYPLEEETGFVLAPLLGWSQDRLDSDEAELRRLSMAWLQKYPLEEEIQFVLAPLLGWSQDRLDNDETQLRELAMAWLQKYPLKEEAGFVLPPLLGWPRDRLDSDEAELCKLALAWLEQFSNALDADFVLKKLLMNDILSEDDRYRLCCRALQLAKDIEGTGNESHILSTLLRLVPRYGNKIPQNEIAAFACRWLDRHHSHPERAMVLARLLENTKLLEKTWLDDPLWIALAQSALTELDARDSEENDDFILNRVARQVWGLDDASQACWLRLACRWIEKWGTEETSQALLMIYRKFYQFSIPEKEKAALNNAYSRRFGGSAIGFL